MNAPMQLATSGEIHTLDQPLGGLYRSLLLAQVCLAAALDADASNSGAFNEASPAFEQLFQRIAELESHGRHIELLLRAIGAGPLET